MEEMECNDLMKYARRLDRSDGTDRAAIVLDFAAVCMTEVSPLLTNAGKRLAIGKVPTSRSGSKVSESSAALERIATGNQSDWRLISEALNAFRRMPKVRVFRRELLDEMHAILRGVQNQDFEDLAEATWAIRDRARHIGRRIDRRIISRTLLVKGLEFDGCVVLDPQELGNKELYVAMTRGASSLTVLTPDGIPEITYAAS
jgi:DNA helicase-2/ATP-dependent DNA helicase PcrA